MLWWVVLGRAGHGLIRARTHAERIPQILLVCGASLLSARLGSLLGVLFAQSQNRLLGLSGLHGILVLLRLCGEDLVRSHFGKMFEFAARVWLTEAAELRRIQRETSGKEREKDGSGGDSSSSSSSSTASSAVDRLLREDEKKTAAEHLQLATSRQNAVRRVFRHLQRLSRHRSFVIVEQIGSAGSFPSSSSADAGDGQCREMGESPMFELYLQELQEIEDFSELVREFEPS